MSKRSKKSTTKPAVSHTTINEGTPTIPREVNNDALAQWGVLFSRRASASASVVAPSLAVSTPPEPVDSAVPPGPRMPSEYMPESEQVSGREAIEIAIDRGWMRVLRESDEAGSDDEEGEEPSDDAAQPEVLELEEWIAQTQPPVESLENDEREARGSIKI